MIWTLFTVRVYSIEDGSNLKATTGQTTVTLIYDVFTRPAREISIAGFFRVQQLWQLVQSGWVDAFV